jgi:LacI family transcriptional regulator
MKNSVTIQDIANSLNMSRNTVSKALNGKSVPAKTRNAVLNAAIEMGYKGYKMAANGNSKLGQKRLVILSTRLLMSINYASYVLKGIEESLSDYDIELLQFRITDAASFSKFMKYLNEYKVDGIICMEFFNSDFITQLLEQGQALLFMDFPFEDLSAYGKYDVIMPESFNVIRNFCTNLIQKEKCKTFGFVGDCFHCRSFYDRFLGMREAMFLSGLTYNPQYSIMKNDSEPYDPDSLADILKTFSEIPDCFVAANDSIAISLLSALKKLGIAVPQKVKIVSFDNVPEAKKTEPPLTTVNINKTSLGKKTVSLLFDRIANPMQSNQTIYIASKIIVRSTT